MMPIRGLNRQEYNIADRVFRGTIPYGRVRITSKIGFRNAPYTLVYSGGLDGEDHWHVNVGKKFTGLETDADGRALLIHELTHVWQSSHSIWSAAYIFDSAWHQITEGATKAYQYASGQPWNSYSVEQQAQIVEDWFAGGQIESDPNFRYVRDNIRTAEKLK